MSSWHSGTKATICLFIGVLLIIVGLLVCPLFDCFFRHEISKNLVLRNGTNLYNMWHHPTVPMHLSVYVLNLTNPEAVRRGGKPHFNQRGPYMYREHLEKVDIRHNVNLTVTYRQRRSYVFLPELSVGPESETFTTINILVVSLASWITYQPSFMQSMANALLRSSSEDLFISLSIQQLLWGYEDPLLRLAKKLLPSIFKDDVVGLLVGKNNTDDGLYTIFTGEDDVSHLGLIDKFNGRSHLQFWSTSYANMINGTDGSLNPPFVSKSTKLRVFQSIICRSGYAVYNSTIPSPRGLALYRFTVPSSAFADVTHCPDNAGFCTPAGHCMGAGVLNLSTCQTVNDIHVPVVISLPNFLRADKQYQDGVSGLHPDSTMDTTVDIEPHTGLVMRSASKLQINIHVKPSQHISLLQHIKPVVFPIIWTNETVSLDDRNDEKLHAMILMPLFVVKLVHYFSLALGSMAALVSLSCFVLLKRPPLSKKSVKAIADCEVTTTEHSPLLDGNAGSMPSKENTRVISQDNLSPSDNHQSPSLYQPN